jgi:glutaredoxin 3
MAVKIYTTSTCPYCDAAKGFFRREGIEFEEINVESSADAAREMVEKSGQMGVPVIEIGKNIIVGFDKRGIKDALKEAAGDQFT